MSTGLKLSTMHILPALTPTERDALYRALAASVRPLDVTEPEQAPVKDPSVTATESAPSPMA